MEKLLIMPLTIANISLMTLHRIIEEKNRKMAFKIRLAIFTIIMIIVIIGNIGE